MEEQRNTVVRTVESKEERFKRLAAPRVNRALEKIGFIGNLASRHYAFTPEQAKKIIMALQGAVSDVERKFQNRIVKKNTFEL